MIREILVDYQGNRNKQEELQQANFNTLCNLKKTKFIWQPKEFFSNETCDFCMQMNEYESCDFIN